MSNCEDYYVAIISAQPDSIKTEPVKLIDNHFPRIKKNQSSIIWFCKK